jgi:putative oxidoreductase
MQDDLDASTGERTMVRRVFLLEDLHVAGDMALLALRLFVGSFLVWGVWDNITSTGRLDEFVAFLRQHGFAAPALMARLSVWAQFGCGVAFIAGVCTRWAGLVCAFNFAVALWMVDAQSGLRASFPAGVLLLFGVLMATLGPGKHSLDARWTGPGPQ